MIYKTVYHFMVDEEIKNFKTVYCLDKAVKEVFIINDMHYASALELLRQAKIDEDRFMFWKEIKENNG